MRIFGGVEKLMSVVPPAVQLLLWSGTIFPSRSKMMSGPFAQSMSLKPVVDNWISEDSGFHHGAPEGAGRLFSPILIQFVETVMSAPGALSMEMAYGEPGPAMVRR